MAARKKATRKRTSSAAGGSKKPSRTKVSTARAAASAKQPTASRAPAAGTAATQALARRLVETANSPESVDLAELYAQTCVSFEPGSGPDARTQGLPALEEKLAGWLALLESAHWTPRNVLVSDDTICIEWLADLKFRDGRTLSLEEVAVHEVRDGKIVAERYYYDPAVLAPPVRAPRKAKPVAVPLVELEEAAEEDDVAGELPDLEQGQLFPGYDDDDEEPGDPIDPLDL